VRAIWRAIELQDPQRVYLESRAPQRTRETFEQPLVAPRTPTEKKVAALWAELLGVDRVGIHDEFLSIGGHSLVAVRLISRIREVFDVEVPLNVLLEGAPTVAALAATIVEYQLAQADDEAIVEMTREISGLSDEQVLRLLNAETELTIDVHTVPPDQASFLKDLM